MAEKMTSDTGTSPQHNVASRRKIINECSQSMRSIIEQRKELNEEAGEIRKRLRDCDINVRGWEAALRMSMMDDREVHDAYLDGFREAYEAMQGEGTVDWIDALKTQDAEASSAVGTA